MLVRGSDATLNDRCLTSENPSTDERPHMKTQTDKSYSSSDSVDLYPVDACTSELWNLYRVMNN